MADSSALPEAGTSKLPEVWDCSDDEDDIKPHQDPKNGSKTQMTTASLILLEFMVVFLLSWQALFRISNMAMDIVFNFISILHKLGEFAESAKLKLLVEAFPNTILKAHILHAINRAAFVRSVIVPINTMTASAMQQTVEVMPHVHSKTSSSTHACTVGTQMQMRSNRQQSMYNGDRTSMH